MLFTFIRKYIDAEKMQHFYKLFIGLLNSPEKQPAEPPTGTNYYSLPNTDEAENDEAANLVSSCLRSAFKDIVELLNTEIIHILFSEMIGDLTSKVNALAPEELVSQGYEKDNATKNLAIIIKKCVQAILLLTICPLLPKTEPGPSDMLYTFIQAVGTGTANNNHPLPQDVKNCIPRSFREILKNFYPNQIIPDDHLSAIEASYTLPEANANSSTPSSPSSSTPNSPSSSRPNSPSLQPQSILAPIKPLRPLVTQTAPPQQGPTIFSAAKMPVSSSRRQPLPAPQQPPLKPQRPAPLPNRSSTPFSRHNSDEELEAAETAAENPFPIPGTTPR
jgi:hypothetical protein